MRTDHNEIRVPKTARYVTAGDVCRCRHLWFVLHGYGMLAQDFIRHFELLVQENAAVVAPEGLHRFYTGGLNGPVGASWMTKEARENDITDYVGYLDAIHERVTRGCPGKLPDVHVLGFSQGAATACRWVTTGVVPAVELVLWSGVFPPDLPLENSINILKNTSLTVVVGNNDALVKPRHLKKQEKLLRELGIPFELLYFQGGHEILPKTLAQLL